MGLIDVASWMPQRWMPAAEIAEASGIPEDVITDRFGLDGKHIAGPDDHVSTMGAAAGRRLLEATGTDPNDIDVVAYFGSMWKDLNVWSAAPKLQADLGLNQGLGLRDVFAHCDGKLARYEIPKRVETIDELPRNAAGKVLKRELRERFGH